MTIAVKDGFVDTRMSRRGFVAGTVGLSFAFTLGGLGRGGEARGATQPTKFNAFVSIAEDNTITIVCPSAEMGQGVYTSLPLILAEELDADWSKVKTEFAPANPKVYGNPHHLFEGAQITAASVSVPGYFTPLRVAGAQARKVLIDACAAQWKVPASELTTESSMVIHRASGKRMSYGDVVKIATVPAELPKIGEGDLKKPSEFKLIGRKDIGRSDVPLKATGKAQYGIDVRVPGMVYASILQSPMEGAKPKEVNTNDVMKVKGVSKVLPLPFGVAVIADTVEATRKAIDALKVTWDTSGAVAAKFDSEKAKADYAAKGKDPSTETKVEYQAGDVKAGLSGAVKTIEAAYWSEYTYHAQMEPMNAVAQVSEDGKSADVWTGTQFGALAGFILSGILKTTPDKIRIHQQFLGGGYGRRIWPDAAIQATILSNIVKKPVKLILTREEDVAAARPRPMTHHAMKAGLDAKGNIVGWHHRLVSENVDAVASPPRFKATGGKDYIGARGLDQAFYAIPNVLAEYAREERGMRVHAWRGIGSGYNKFAAEAFLDEVGQAAGKDPLALRLELTKDHPRAQAVLKAVVEMSDFSRKRPGHGLGIAFSDYHGTFSAGVAEVSFDDKTGKIKVHNYWIAVDPGIVVQPDNVHAQLESAVVYGLSAALIEEFAVKDGAVQASNFDSYPVMRMSDVPEIHTRIVATDNAPSGMGEIGVVTVAPAIANAMFQLTGKRLRHLPMTPDRVKATMKT
ncbi:molybdopterin cofactor-binding domain-containing protein [Pseudolabrys sp. FHR47]|uniref:xanthine dehydrogenase family protein molybdopterin-binding subunit n=1 Tax=Pseudolabrys sp. FHR47 TaxID=2562284 RepID=UPI0010BF1E04|nr:molybdopterin cofactor-binding domain-containing protein [Pseudolabrys sp. FHR47]